MPSAVLLSLLIHVGLFLLAGTLVVFTVVKKEEKKFVPPKSVEQPRMTLRKPKVKVKKSTKPKPTTRIAAKVGRTHMPDLQLPEMSGMAIGFDADVGGFDLAPDFSGINVFGSGQTIGNDFVGTFYDFLKDRRGRRIPMDPSRVREILEDFIANGWRSSDLSRFYRSPRKLYATTCMFPCMESVLARIAFGEFEEGHEPNDHCWAVHYKGQLVHREGIRFRFWGVGNSILTVRVDGEIVLDAPYIPAAGGFVPTWRTSSTDSYKYFLGYGRSLVGDWITLEPGVPLNMDYLFVDFGGGAFGATLLVEVEGEEYETNRQGGPLLPVFKTAELSYDFQDAILKWLVPGEATLAGGPVFCDYDLSPKTTASPPAKAVRSATFADGGIRTWTLLDGRTIPARFKSIVASNIVLENEKGKLEKIPLSRLSMEDRAFAELERPPRFNIGFSRKTSRRKVPPSRKSSWLQPKLFDHVYTATLKQTSAGAYNHPLHIEFFAIGKQINGSDRYILLDRQTASFVPSKENRRSFEFHGDRVLLVDQVFYYRHQGEKYASYLVTITDERGKIIQHATPNKWLFEHLENLKRLPVGGYMDKSCARVHPASPKPFRY